MSAALLTLGWLAGGSADSPADALVVAGTAPGFTPGRELRGGPIAAPGGTRLVLLLETGRLVTVEGPYVGPLRAPEGDVAGRLGGLARLGGTDRTEIGGTRSVARAIRQR
jgi:hypothetical protein